MTSLRRSHALLLLGTQTRSLQADKQDMPIIAPLEAKPCNGTACDRALILDLPEFLLYSLSLISAQHNT